MSIHRITKTLFDQGLMVVVLVLCCIFSLATIKEQSADGLEGARFLAGQIHGFTPENSNLLVLANQGRDEQDFLQEMLNLLQSMGFQKVDGIAGDPREIRLALEKFAARKEKADGILCSNKARDILLNLNLTEFRNTRILSPLPHRWPTFLKKENLLNITNQISVIAIIAIGMTMVVIAGGIDLSVGSLVALGAVISTLWIREIGGGRDASAYSMLLGAIAGISACTFLGWLNGFLITRFTLPPFIVTLAMMLIAQGTAFRLTDGETIFEIPDSFVWLGRGADLFLTPNSALLMIILFGIAHWIMMNTVLGRHLYAVGGNREAARRSGISVNRTIRFTYALSGLLAGLGGVILASQLKSASPNFGAGYELYVIAAVVVGGSSLAGGRGKILGTLLGAFLIAIIQNGMNLMGVNPFTQKIALGSVILAAVLLDQWKSRSGSLSPH